MKKICYYCIGILSLFSCQQETELAETSPSGGEQIQFVLAVDNDKNTRVTTTTALRPFLMKEMRLVSLRYRIYRVIQQRFNLKVIT